MSPDVFCDILEELRAFFEKHSISTYDEVSGKGLMRHIYLRRSEESGEVLVTLVINGKSFPHEKELIEALTKRFPNVCGILLNVNTESTNVILGEKFITLYGNDYITDTLAGVKLKITAPSFYQVNHGTATLIYEEARRLAALEENDVLLDLFCGAGSIGLSMAKDCRELIGIEIIESAVECARYNAEQNGIKNAKFYTGDAANAEDFLKNAEAERGEAIRPDVIILDPPRAGSDEKLLKFVASLSPRRIVYISCNPATLARDVAILRPLGYTTNTVRGYDMFPMTGHVESVVCLTRRDSN
jgi:23S rRNA (uracil1939-C5)-methyltransferase